MPPTAPPAPETLTIAELAARAGRTLGCSDWLRVDQTMIDAFADVTRDHQFIHTDPARARAEAGLPGTIAHGFLTLSLLSHLGRQVFPDIRNRVMTFNYGLNRVRFLTPVPEGARIRARITLQSVTPRGAGRHLCSFESVVEIEGHDSPALVAEQLLLHVIDEEGEDG